VQVSFAPVGDHGMAALFDLSTTGELVRIRMSEAVAELDLAKKVVESQMVCQQYAVSKYDSKEARWYRTYIAPQIAAISTEYDDRRQKHGGRASVDPTNL
jgi:hypothetical protein